MSKKHVTFDDSGFLLFSSLTTNYQNLLTLTDDADILVFYNTTDAIIYLRVPSYTSTKELRFPPKSSLALDFRMNDKRIAKGVIQAKYSGSAPTVGEVTIFPCR